MSQPRTPGTRRPAKAPPIPKPGTEQYDAGTIISVHTGADLKPGMKITESAALRANRRDVAAHEAKQPAEPPDRPVWPYVGMAITFVLGVLFDGFAR